MSAKLDIEINLAINADMWTALEQAAEFNGLPSKPVYAGRTVRKARSRGMAPAK